MKKPIEMIASQGMVDDLKAVDGGRLVVLHQWTDGCLLVMSFDDEMPAFTAKPFSPNDGLRLIEVMQGDARPNQKPELEATGYVFAVYEPTHDGHTIFGGKRFGRIEIYDYVVWTNDEEVRAKYREVVQRAASEA